LHSTQTSWNWSSHNLKIHRLLLCYWKLRVRYHAR